MSGCLTGNKITDKIQGLRHQAHQKLLHKLKIKRNTKRKIMSPEKRQRIINEL